MGLAVEVFRSLGPKTKWWFDGDIEAGETASGIVAVPEPGLVTTLVDWHRGEDRILLAWEHWPGDDGSGALGAEILAAIRG